MRLRYSLFMTAALVSALILLLSTMPFSSSAGSDKDKLTTEEVIAKHLEAIGPAGVRSSVKSRVILGTALATFRLGSKGQAQGRSVLASQEDRNLIGITFDLSDYPHENMGFDGKKFTAAEISPGVKSTLGKFFLSHEMPFREGLITGVLSASWPLLNPSASKGTLKYDGSKRVDGQLLQVLRYEAKNDSGLKTRLYFDAETFRHVRTEYEQRIVHPMASQPGVTQQLGDAVAKLSEEFSDFKTENGLTLPHQYRLQLSIESLNRRVLQDWAFTLSQFVFNKSLDQKQFDVTAN